MAADPPRGRRPRTEKAKPKAAQAGAVEAMPPVCGAAPTAEAPPGAPAASPSANSPPLPSENSTMPPTPTTRPRRTSAQTGEKKSAKTTSPRPRKKKSGATSPTSNPPAAPVGEIAPPASPPPAILIEPPDVDADAEGPPPLPPPPAPLALHASPAPLASGAPVVVELLTDPPSAPPASMTIPATAPRPAQLVAPPHHESRGPKSRFPLRRILPAAAIAAVMGILLLVALIWHTPDWYRPPDVPPERHQAVRDELQDMTNRFSDLLLRPEPFLIEFTDRQLNEWISMRDRIWPKLRDAIPSDVATPCLRFRSDRIDIAARVVRLAGEPVVTARLSVALEGEEISIRLVGCRVGSMSVPLSWFLRALPPLRLKEHEEDVGFRLRGDAVEGFRLPARMIWWNGRRDFRVRRIETSPGVLRMEIEPLGPWPRDRHRRAP